MTNAQIKNWFDSRRYLGIATLKYQLECIGKINAIHTRPKAKKLPVLAACPSAGKTLMTICYIDWYHKTYPDSKILVLAHSTSILRKQFFGEIRKLEISFKYALVEPGVNLNNAHCDNDVLVTLPQTIGKRFKKKFDLIIVDEAHHNYLAEDGLVQSIIKNSKPKHQLLLTGTPSKFIRKKDKYAIISVTVGELLDYGMITDVIVELASSTYDVRMKDYNNNHELREGTRLSKKDTNATLDTLLEHVLGRLKSVYKNNPEKYSLLKRITTWDGALKNLQKTMIACYDQEQAEQVRDYLRARGIEAALSTSDEDIYSEEVDRFIERVKLRDKKGNLVLNKFGESIDTEKFANIDCSVLIVVRRGVLGFNLPELENIIDMTCSHNPDVIFQLLGRVLRKHPNDRKKLFFKIVPHNLSDWFDHVMTVTLSLTDKEYYEKFNGKNFLDMSILVETRRERNRKPTPPGPRPSPDPKPPTFKKVNFEGLPAIRFMIDLLHKKRAELNGYAHTKMSKVQHEFMKMRKIKGVIFDHSNVQKTIEEHIADFIAIHG